MSRRLHSWTSEQLLFLKDNYPLYSAKELTQLFNKRFNITLTLGQVEGALSRNKFKCGRTGRFEKGQKTWNKGMKGLNLGGKETQYKKGQLPPTVKPIGTERLNKDGYIVIKVSDTMYSRKNWKLKHRHVWEQVHGPVPKSHVLIFLDQDKTNCSLDNLMLIPRSKLARMCQNHLFFDQPEATKTGSVLADIYSKMGKRKKEIKQ